MKKYLILFAVIVLVSCKKMDHYEITGNIQDVPDNTIISLFQMYDNVGRVVATDTIINGKFNFTGTLSDKPTRMNLLIQDRNNFSGSCQFWSDYTKIRISGSGNFLSTWDVSSDISEQKILNLFNNKTKNQKRLIDSLSLVRMTDLRNRELQTFILNEMDSLSKIALSIEFEVLKNNINSLTSLSKLYEIAAFSTTDKEVIRNVFNKMDEKYKNTLLGEGILTKLDQPVPPRIGDKLIDLNLHDLNGKQFKLSEFSGKYILLDFWSLGCYPCVLAAPELREINETYKNDLIIIGINLDTNPKLWEEATKRDSVTWINLTDGKGTYAGAYSLYGIMGMPTYILINPDDTIIEKWTGFGNGIFKEKLAGYITKN
jgi:thiol-disulfide isomerase/thioredoxin